MRRNENKTESTHVIIVTESEAQSKILGRVLLEGKDRIATSYEWAATPEACLDLFPPKTNKSPDGVVFDFKGRKRTIAAMLAIRAMYVRFPIVCLINGEDDPEIPLLLRGAASAYIQRNRAIWTLAWVFRAVGLGVVPEAKKAVGWKR